MRPFTGISEPDLEIALLRKGVGALAAGRHALRDCGRTPLVGERVYTLRPRGRRSARCAARCAAPSPSASELVRHSERGHAVRVLPRACACANRLRRRRGPRHRLAADDRPAARGGLRVPRGHRQPRGVHRPLPGRLAPDARGLLRRRRRRALQAQDAPGNRFPWGDATFIEVEAPRRIVEVGRGGKFNRIRTRGVYELEPRSPATTRVDASPSSRCPRRSRTSSSSRWARAAGSSARTPRRCAACARSSRRTADRGARADGRRRGAQARLRLPLRVPHRDRSVDSALRCAASPPR